MSVTALEIMLACAVVAAAVLLAELLTAQDAVRIVRQHLATARQEGAESAAKSKAAERERDAVRSEAGRAGHHAAKLERDLSTERAVREGQVTHWTEAEEHYRQQAFKQAATLVVLRTALADRDAAIERFDAERTGWAEVFARMRAERDGALARLARLQTQGGERRDPE